MDNYKKKVTWNFINNVSCCTHNSRIVTWKKQETETICSQVNVNVSTFNKIITSISKLVKQTQIIYRVSKPNFKVNHVLLIVPPLIVLTNSKFNSQVLSPSSNSEVPVGVVSKSQNNDYFHDQLLRSFKPVNSTATGIDNNTSLIKSRKAYLGISSVSSENPTNIIVGKELQQFQSKLNKENFSPELMQKQLTSFVEGYSFALEGVILHNSSWKPYNMYIGLCIFTVWLVYNATLTVSMSSLTQNMAHSTTKFDNVKGVEKEKQKLKNTRIVEFFKTPEKCTVLCGKLSRGVLLVGLSGTGKTLLAEAVMAGEGGVPFFYTCLDSEFDEVYIGVGARRVRELFRIAKVNIQCILYIDEIGIQRTTSAITHRRTNDTINQLLLKIDGFNNREAFLLATNRKEDLDESLMRSGRFDAKITVLVPDFRSRKELLEFYLGKVKHQHVDIEKLARGTTMLTGADIGQLVNQATVRATAAGAKHVSTEYLEFTRNSSLMVPESLSRVTDEGTDRITVYHEGGQHPAPLHEVTIITRGQSLVHIAYIPDRDIHRVSQLLASLDVTLEGRAAQDVVFGPDSVTSGASGDLEEVATMMVRRWGMSEAVTYSDHTMTSPEMRFSSIRRSKHFFKSPTRQPREC